MVLLHAYTDIDCPDFRFNVFLPPRWDLKSVLNYPLSKMSFKLYFDNSFTKKQQNLKLRKRKLSLNRYHC